LTDELTKIAEHVFLHLVQLCCSPLVPMNLHTATVSWWWNTSS
jgi:hypothetical protein